MAYTTIDDPTLFFDTTLWSTVDTSIDTLNFQPDWVWLKSRSNADTQVLFDSVRGVNKRLSSSGTGAESTTSDELTAFNSDGFTLGTGDNVNRSSQTMVAWSWKAGGTAPAITYTVKVVSDSGNKYRFDDFGTSAVTLELQDGGTYTFDQSDSSNSGHPLRFSTTSNGTHGGGSEYTTGVTTTGTPGSSGAKTVITVAASAPTLYYYCTQHSGMGGQANTNSTFGSSNFSGSIQSTVSANTTAGFSIGKYTGTGSNATIGHGLGSTPSVIFVKKRNSSGDWNSFHNSLGNTGAMQLDHTGTFYTNSTIWNNTSPTSSVFSVGTWTYTNNGSDTYVFYALAEKKGYSKFGSYTGNNNADGTFIYTGFKPAWVLMKASTASEHWNLHDNKRDPFNVCDAGLKPNENNAEEDFDRIDFVSNGFKHRSTSGGYNSSNTFLYMAFAESPFVNSNGVPTNAR